MGCRHDVLCDVAAQLWRPLGDDIDLPTVPTSLVGSET